MSLLGGTITPLIDIHLYDPGEADPRVTDRGFAWWDSLAQSYNLGYSNLDSRGTSRLVWMQDIGLTCRPVPTPQDTRKLDWSPTLGASWDEWRPDTGRFAAYYRLVQYDTSPGLVFSTSSRALQPANPNLWFTLWVADVPADWDSSSLEPYAQVAWGNGAYRFAIRRYANGACMLLIWDTALADFHWGRDLQSPQRSPDGDEFHFYVLHKRGRVGVSSDFGKTYEWLAPGTREPAGAQFNVPAGKITLSGQGGEVRFGLHKLTEHEGVWLSPQQPTLTSTFFGSALLSGRYDAPAGLTSNASVTFADVSDTLNALAQYEATLTPNSEGQGPVLYSTILRYLVDHEPGSGAYHTPWTGTTPSPAGHGRAVECHISKPNSLKEATCTIRIKLNPTDTPLTALRRRKIVVRLGYRTFTAGVPTDHYWTAFTGYTGERDEDQQAFGDGWQTIKADAAAKWTRVEWWPTDVLPLGGALLNDSLDYVLSTEGVEGLDLPQYRAWHALGNSFLLPPGSPEEPFELIRASEKKWETLERLAGYAGMELGIDDSAILFTLVKNPSGVPATTGVSHDYKASGEADLEKIAKSLSSRTDYDLSATAVLFTGVNQATGLAMRFYGVDVTAETDQSSERYCPWREGGADGQQIVQDPCTPGLLLYRTAEQAYALFPIKAEPDLASFLNLGVSRRDEVKLYGFAGISIPDATSHVVLTSEHVWKQPLEGGAQTLESSLGLWRIPT